MRSDRKRFILENIDKMSVKDIAGKLGVKQRKIARFLEKKGIESSEEKKQVKIPDIMPDMNLCLSDKTFPFKREMLTFAIIVLAAFLIRFVYLLEIRTSPFFTPMYNILDDYLYDSWAMNIAGGDVIGSEVFYGLPLYPYFLGLIYAVFGHSIFVAKTIQAFIGSLSCGLIYFIGRKAFSRGAGICAAIIAVIFPALIFFEGFLTSVFLSVFLNSLLILFLFSIKDKPSVLKWITAGLLAGISSLANASVLLFLPLALFWAYRTGANGTRKQTVTGMILMIIAVCAAISPVTYRNYAVSGEFVPVTVHGGITFYAGNNPGSSGSFNLPKSLGTNVAHTKKNARAVAERSLGESLSPSEVSKFWSDQAVMFIKENPGRYAGLVMRKIFLFWNVHEIPDIVSRDFYARYSRILRFPLPGFAVISPLAILGMLMCMKLRNDKILLLYLFVLSSMIATTIYFVNSRYRLAAFPAISVFSGAVCFWLFVNLKNKTYRSMLLPSAALLLIIPITYIRMLEFRPAQMNNNLGIVLKRKGMIAEAINEYKHAIKIDPDYSSPHFNLGLIYLESGKPKQAIPHFYEALRINPELAVAHNKIALAYLRTGQKNKAIFHLKESLSLDNNQPEIRALLRQHG